MGVGLTQQGSVAGRPDVTVTTDEAVSWGRVVLPVRVTTEGILVKPGPERFERRVTTARGVEIRLARNRIDDTLAESLTVLDGRITAGSLASGTRETFAFELRLDTDLPPGEYQLPVVVSYNFTSFVEYEAITEPSYTDRTRRELQTVTLVVADRPNLVVETPPDQQLRQGRTGTYRVTVRNTGTRTARNVAVRLTTPTSGLRFGDDRGSRLAAFVQSIPPGESVTVTTVVTASPRLPPQQYLVTARVDYGLATADRTTTVRQRLGLNVTASSPPSDVAPRSISDSASLSPLDL